MGLRDMDVAGKFVTEDSSKPDPWKNASRSEKQIKKYGGDTRLSAGETCQ